MIFIREVLYFSVYEHQFVIKNNEIITRKFIVLRSQFRRIVSFTDFHKYARPYNQKTVRKFTDDGNNRIYYVTKFLNYVFFEKFHIEKLLDIRIEMISDFLNDYGKGMLPNDKKERTKQTVETCISVIIDFCQNLLKAFPHACKFEKKNLFKTVPVRDKYGKIKDKVVPAFDVTYTETPKVIFRDMPDAVFVLLMNEIIHNHKDILMLVALSAFAGLRPSEACNIRRADSALGAGIRMVYFEGEITDVILDLRKELNLRSDLVSVGRIKRERVQRVYPAFLPTFLQCYEIYMKHIAGKKYEADYGPLNLNKQGKAITYTSYYQKFQKAIEALIPTLLKNDNPEVVNYGHLLMEHRISPHILRHWFSVKLTLYGEDVSGLKYWRGDNKPESALTYLENKSELEKQYRYVNSQMFDFLNWKATKKYGGNYG